MIAPLDWGLGHTTRCIPIISALLANGFEVFIAAEKEAAALLQKEFSTVKILTLNGYRIKYAANKKHFLWKMFLQIPKILRAIKNENKWLKQVVKDNKIDIVISDNRFGMYNKNAHCIFITHQLFIKTGNAFTEKIAQKINYYFIHKFNKCWVIDEAGENNLAGELSHPAMLPKISLSYIGILSRFKKIAIKKDLDILLLLSGPEPQRTIFENALLQQIKTIPLKIALVRGLPNEVQTLLVENVTVYNHLPAAALSNLILSSNIIVARSGYTTVMDLASLQQPAIFVPTAGQTEQQYLAEYLSQKKYCIAENQENFNLKQQIIKFANATLLPYPYYNDAVLIKEINLLK